MPRNRISFSSLDVNTIKLMKFYGAQHLFSSIVPLNPRFPGFDIANAIQTRMQITLSNIGFTTKLLRQGSYRTSDTTTNSPKAVAPIIELSKLYDNIDQNQKICVLVTGENSLDLRKLGEYMTYNWAKGQLWERFDIVIRADLSELVSKIGIVQSYTLAQLLSESLGTGQYALTAREISNILMNDAIRSLIILNGYHTVSHLLKSSEHNYIKSILTDAVQHNVIITTKNYLTVEAEHLLKPNIILEDKGLTSFKDIQSYLEQNFQNEDYKYLKNLFDDNKEFYKISRSPSILEMLCFVLIEGKETGLRTTQISTTTTSVYYDMVFLLGSKYAGKYHPTYQNDIFALPIVRFMQELAYKSPAAIGNAISDRFLLEIMLPYRNAILEGLPHETDPMQLLKEFGLLMPDSTPSLTEQNYRFINFAFHEFIGSFHLKNLLVSGEDSKVKEAKAFIAMNCDKIKYLQIMKFLSGLVSMELDERSKLVSIKHLWDAITASNEEILKIGGDSQIILMMNLLSQARIQGELDPDVPTEITDYLDSNILKNLDKWGSYLISTQYLSNTIINELANKLMGTKTEFLQAVNVIAFLKINNAEQKQIIADNLISKAQFEDIVIVENAINALQLMLDSPRVRNFLFLMLDDLRVDIVLMAMEVVSKAKDEIFIDNLLSKLSDKNNLIIIGAIDALKNFNYLKTSREKISNDLLKMLGTLQYQDDVILSKLLECLQFYHYNHEQIYSYLLNLLKKDTDLSQVERAIIALKDLTVIKKILNSNVIIDDFLARYSKFIGIMSYSKYYPHRKDIIEAMGEIYAKADSSHQSKIYELLERNLNSRSEIVQEAVITALHKIIPHLDHKEQALDILYKAASNTKFLQAKYLAFATIIKLSQTIKIDSNIFNNSINIIIHEYSQDPDFAVASIELLGIVSHPIAIEKIRAMLASEYFSQTDKATVIAEIGEISSKFGHEGRIALLALLYQEMDQNHPEEVRIALLIALRTMYPQVKNIQDVVITSHLHSFLLDQNSDVIKDLAVDACLTIHDSYALSKLMKELLVATQDPIVKRAAMYSLAAIIAKVIRIPDAIKINDIIDLFVANIEEIPDSLLFLSKILHKASLDKLAEVREVQLLFSKYIEAKAFAEEYITLIEDLLDKYNSDTTLITLRDQTILNNLFQIILFRGLHTSSAIMQNQLFNLALKANFTTEQVLDFIDLELSRNNLLKDKNKIIEIFKTLFCAHPIVNKLITLSHALEQQNSIDNQFPDLQSILDNEQGFAMFVAQNNLDVQITKDRMILLDKEYALDTLDDLELQLFYAKKIFLSIIASSNQLVQASSIASKLEHIFYDITKIHLSPEKVQLSILHQTTDRNSPTDIILITEQKTIFGDILVKRIVVRDGNHDISVYRSLDNDYYIQILGGPDEYKLYHLKSISITLEEEKCLLRALGDGANLFDKLKTVFPEYFAHYNWRVEAKVISHNQLIRYDGMREEVSAIKARLSELESKMTELEAIFKEFKLSQKATQEIVASLKASINLDQALPSLNEYQTGLYLALAHGLNEVYMAAMIQNELHIAKTGAWGSIGNFFSRISTHVPIAGVAVDFLGSIISAVDKAQQTRMAKNIANLAINSVEAANLIRKLSLIIATSNLKTENFNDQVSILETIANSFDFVSDIRAHVIEAVTDSVSSHFMKKASVTGEYARGENDGQIIAKILTSYIAAGHCYLALSWQNNFDILYRFFKNEYISTERIIEFSQDITANTPLKIKTEVESDTHLITVEANKMSYDFSFPAGVVMTIMKDLPSFKYLLTHYIPVLPLFKDTYIGELCAKYEYSVSVGLYSLGVLTYGYLNALTPLVQAATISAFAIREPMYKYRAEAHAYINWLEQNEPVKFALYTISDTLIFLTMTLPLVSVTSSDMASLVASGVTTSVMNYYSAHSSGEMSGYIVAFGTTTTALAYCTNKIIKQTKLQDRIIATDICANMLAGVHFISKISTDFVIDSYTLLMGNEMNNVTETLI